VMPKERARSSPECKSPSESSLNISNARRIHFTLNI
jgi:hypothetical protein